VSEVVVDPRFSRYQLSKGFNPITWVMTRLQRWGSLQKAESRHKRVIAHERLLAIELALRCYQSEQGRVPVRLEELVPNYLSVKSPLRRTSHYHGMSGVLGLKRPAYISLGKYYDEFLRTVPGVKKPC
jgi:hypothetical protein